MIERPAARYGRQPLPRRTRRWIVIGATSLVVVAGVIVAVVASQRFGAAEVEGELSAYRLIDDETVSVTIGVTRPDPSIPVVCILRARSFDGSEIGRREVLVGPSDQSTMQVSALVKTTRPPVVGDIYGCGAEVPSYLVAP